MSTSISRKKVSRSDGKASKTAILDATLILVIRDGLRGIKYQTVAELAGVANSAVAYYFGDIDALIQQAFRHYFEKYSQTMSEVRGIGQYVISSLNHDNTDEKGFRAEFIEKYCGVLLQLIATKDPAITEYMLLDRIFRNETLTNKPLYRILKQQDQLDIDAIERIFITLQTEAPAEEAVQFMSLLWYLSEKLVQEDYSAEQISTTKSLIEYSLKKILAI